jgi:hypothetical protein
MLQRALNLGQRYWSQILTNFWQKKYLKIFMKTNAIVFFVLKLLYLNKKYNFFPIDWGQIIDKIITISTDLHMYVQTKQLSNLC